jgi:hypothetical protein
LATSSNVIQFPRTSATPAETSTGDDVKSKATFRTTNSVDEPMEVQGGRITIEELYPSSEAAAPELNAALRLLANGLDCVNKAFEATKKGHAIEGDDAIQRLQALLPELFNCRTLGDGYGAIINALLGSLENMHGVPLNEGQIMAIREVLGRVRSEPFLEFNSALDEIDKLEQANFVVVPPGFEELTDWLDE